MCYCSHSGTLILRFTLESMKNHHQIMQFSCLCVIYNLIEVAQIFSEMRTDDNIINNALINSIMLISANEKHQTSDECWMFYFPFRSDVVCKLLFRIRRWIWFSWPFCYQNCVNSNDKLFVPSVSKSKVFLVVHNIWLCFVFISKW